MTLRTAAALTLAAGAALAADNLLITGAGATFPAPLYTKWFAEYNKQHPTVQINYQSIGSGGGIKQITERTVEFGASDSPMTDEELARAPGLVHVPTVLGAVVVTYHLPALAGLQLSPDTIAAIFLGKIVKWNDPALARDNPQAALPDAPITVAHRSDGSGTTGVFVYVSDARAAGKSVKWPVGLGGKGNEGVTGLIKATPGAVGYVELAYANQNQLPLVAVKNSSGRFVVPSIESTSAAAAGVDLPADYRVSITNPPGPAAYPIASFTYLLIYRDQPDEAKGPALIGFLDWAIHGGQALAAPLDYAPLPKPVVARLEKTIGEFTVKGKPALARGK